MLDRSIINHIKGCLYGQAIGDALGLGSEFMTKVEVQRYYPKGLCSYNQIIQDYHRKRWIKGDWTDDTDMMLCLLKAFTNNGFDVTLAAQNFKDWFNGCPMGIGRHTIKVLMCEDYIEHPFEVSRIMWELSRNTSAANGALMRTSVMGLWPEINDQWTSEACQLTHYDQRCINSCIIATHVIHDLVWNNIIPNFETIYKLALDLDKEAAQYVVSSYKSHSIDMLHLDLQPGIGYTYRTLSAALWSLWHSESFIDGLLKVVNEGGDADTNAAISCAILGARFGYDKIPIEYIETLYYKQEYCEMVSEFINKIILFQTGIKSK